MGVLSESMAQLRREIVASREARVALQEELIRQTSERRTRVSGLCADFARDRAGANRAWNGPSAAEREAEHLRQERKLAQERAQAEADELQRREAAERAKAQAEARQRQKEEARAKAQAAEQQRLEEEARAKAQAEEQRRLAEQARAKAQAEEKAAAAPKAAAKPEAARPVPPPAARPSKHHSKGSKKH